MCAALRDREVMHDLVVGAAFGRTIEDFATMRWRGRRRSNAGFWGFGAVGPQDRKREKRALHDPILTQQRPRSSSTRHTSPDSTTTWPSHRGGWGETGSVYKVKLNRLHSHRTGRGTQDTADGGTGRDARAHSRTRPQEGTRENANTPTFYVVYSQQFLAGWEATQHTQFVSVQLGISG